METSKQWKIILSLAAIFAAGAVTGGVITFQTVRKMVQARTNPDQWPGRVFRDYRNRLKLEPGQQERIRPILTEAGRKMKRTRAEYLQAHGQLMREIHAALLPVLTPEQIQVLDEIKAEQMQRMRERGLMPGRLSFPDRPRPNGTFGRPADPEKKRPPLPEFNETGKEPVQRD